jgi:hypothetical protein
MQDPSALEELVLQGLETELGGVEVYRMALKCVVNDTLKEEWTEYLAQTEEHVQIMADLIASLGLDPNKVTPGRDVVRHIGESLVAAMGMALSLGNGPSPSTQLVAAECVVSAETKDHLNWELIGFAIESTQGDLRRALKEAHDRVEEQEDEHLYHTKGWSRELWLESMGIPAVLPPPEEERDVKTAIGAARAKMARREML